MQSNQYKDIVIKRFLKSNWPIISIIVIAAALRFWRIESLTTFSGDQGYDFIIIKRIIVDHKFTLLGPKIGPYNGHGDVFLGPAYYYILAPALFLSRLDPIGPAILTAVLGTLTVLIIYVICVKFLTKSIALWAASFYALSAFLIAQSRAPSNPHLIPFFSALALFSFLEITVAKSKRKIWPIFLGASMAIMFQLHYLAVSAIIAFAVAAAFTVRRNYSTIKPYLYTFCAFILVVSPQIIFELRHKFFITGQILRQLNNGQTIASLSRLIDHLKESISLMPNLIIGVQKDITPVTALIIVFVIWYWLKNKYRRTAIGLMFLIITLGFIFASLYFGQVNPHYLASTYPALIIATAVAIDEIKNIWKHPLYQLMIMLAAAQIFTINIANLNLNAKQGYTMPSGWNLKGAKIVSSIIKNDINDSETFNVANTLDGDTRAMPIRYLLESSGKPPQPVENYPSVDSLYLVSRDDENSLKSYTVWEVSSFAPFDITGSWDIQNGIKLYKLTKHKTHVD